MGCTSSKPRFSEPASVLSAGGSGRPQGRRQREATEEVSTIGREGDATPAAGAHSTNGRSKRHIDPHGPDTHTVDVVHPVTAPAAPSVPPSASPSGKKDPRFKSNGPSEQGDILACFKDGLLYRIVQPNAWFFYNDTQDYEMHVSFTFGGASEITAVPPAVLSRGATDDASFVVSVVVYPGETSPFIEGRYSGYKSNIAARPLSTEYRNKVNAQANLKVQRELDVIQKLSRGSKDIQRIVDNCVSQGILFVDVSFPPLHTSLYRPAVDSRVLAETAWKRPTDYLPLEAHKHIGLFCNGIDPNDIDQGQLGDCWLLCSIAALAEFPSKVEDLFAHPVSEAVAEQERRVGAYRVTLNKHGWWHIILVDDYLPVIGAKPCFAKCVEDPAELWVSLLEKAYAKLHGSYAAITGGDALQALQDLTGYPVYRFDNEWMDCAADATKGNALFQKLLDYDQRHFLININTPGHDVSNYMGERKQSANGTSLEERYKKAGLGLGHAYTALQVRYFPRHNLRLLQIRNPWGNGVEWTGRWGDGDALWQSHPDVAAAVEYQAAEDGTFWMCWEDALCYFDGGGVCFTRFDWHDYRARGRFENGYPNLVFQVVVEEPIEAYVTISQKDKRGLAPSDPEAKYCALMLSISSSVDGDAANQKIHLNSSENTEEPSEEFTFNYGRDLGLKYTFTPQGSPYYVIPRIYDAGGNRDYVMGLISDHPCGHTRAAKFRVNFVSLPKTCRVFHNYPAFHVDGTVPLVTEYQRNPEVGAPETKKGSWIG